MATQMINFWGQILRGQDLTPKLLGFNQSNADEFINQVQQGVLNNPATLGKLDSYGQRYTVIIPMTGPNGSTVPVLTGWIFDPGSTIPRLTTTYVK